VSKHGAACGAAVGASYAAAVNGTDVSAVCTCSAKARASTSPTSPRSAGRSASAATAARFVGNSGGSSRPSGPGLAQWRAPLLRHPGDRAGVRQVVSG